MTPTKQQFTDAIANFQRLADLIDRPIEPPPQVEVVPPVIVPPPVVVPPPAPPPKGTPANMLPTPTPTVVMPPDTVDAAFYLAQAPGTVRTVFLDTIMAHDPAIEWKAAYPGIDWPWRGVSGIASAIEDSAIQWCPDYGSLGAFYSDGGGHGGYGGCESYLHILGARKVARLNYPSNKLYKGPILNGDDPGSYWRGYPWHRDTGERWAAPFLAQTPAGDWVPIVTPPYPVPAADLANWKLGIDAAGNRMDHLNEKATIPNTISASHVYDYPRWVPNGFGHTDPQGAILNVGRPAMFNGGSQSTRVATIFLLSQPALGHQRFSTNMMSQLPGYNGSILDKFRHRIVVHDFSGNFQLLDLDSKLWSQAPKTPIFGGSPAYHGTLFHLQLQDVYIYIVAGGKAPLTNTQGWVSYYVINPDTFAVTKPGAPAVPNFQCAQGTTVVPTIGGTTYNEDIQALVYYPGYGNTVYEFMLGSNVKTDPLTLVTKDFTGEQGNTQYSPGQAFHERRFHWVGKLQSYFWLAGVDRPMQQFRV